MEPAMAECIARTKWQGRLSRKQKHKIMGVGESRNTL